MKVLIIGGTAFMGPRVVHYLHQMGHQVAVFHRGKTQGDLPQGVTRFLGDQQDLASHRETFAAFGPDVVLHMKAMTIHDAWRFVRVFEDIAPRSVVASSMDVYQAFGHIHHLEDAPFPTGPYDEKGPLRTTLFPYRDKATEMSEDPERIATLRDYDKILVESLIMGHAALPGTILRLPAVYGPHDPHHRLHDTLKRIDDGRDVILIDEIKANWRWSRGYVDNIAWGIVQAVVQERAAGHIFNVAEEHAWTLREWLQRIGDTIGWKGKIIEVSQAELPKHLQEEERFTHDVVCSSAKLREILGYQEQVDLDKALQETIDWEQENPPEVIDPDDFQYDAEDEAIAQLNRA